MPDSQPCTRLFTLDEAQTLLSEIEPLVAEMKATFEKIRGEVKSASEASGLAADSPQLSRHLRRRGIASALVGRVNELIQSIHEKGCVVNGPEAGLVDFPALFDSEIVFLCWKHGEPGIGHWHRIPDGFAGRRPLLDLESGASQESSPTVH